VRSLNGDACAAVEELVQVQRTPLGSVSSSEFVRRTFRDVPFELSSAPPAAPPPPLQASSASSALSAPSVFASLAPLEPFSATPFAVAVERDAVQHQLLASLTWPGSVRAVLVPGGSVVEPNEASVMERVARLLVGVFEGDRQLRSQRVLHLGFAATVAGSLELRGGRLVLCAHPELGLFVLPRGGVEACAAQLRRHALLAWVGSAAIAGAAVYSSPRARHAVAAAADAMAWACAEAAFRLGLSAPEAAPQRPFVAGGSESVGVSSGGGDGGDSGGQCCICMDAAASAVFVPCGHRACCAPCALRLATERRHLCPVCRTPFRDVVGHVYDA
jgi:hypothetical protein